MDRSSSRCLSSMLSKKNTQFQSPQSRKWIEHNVESLCLRVVSIWALSKWWWWCVCVCVCVVQVVKGLCPHADLAIGDPDGLHLLQLLLNLLNLSSVLVMWLNSGSSFTISKAWKAFPNTADWILGHAIQKDGLSANFSMNPMAHQFFKAKISQMSEQATNYQDLLTTVLSVAGGEDQDGCEGEGDVLWLLEKGQKNEQSLMGRQIIAL